MKNEQKNNESIKKIDECLKPLEFKCVDINEHKNSSQSYLFSIYVVREDGNEINTDDLKEAYDTVYPFLQVSRNCKNITLEISSPGVERKIKDCYEFHLFVKKNARIYVQDKDMWIYGTISKADENSVTLKNAFNDKEKLVNEDVVINFENIKKANLLLELNR